MLFKGADTETCGPLFLFGHRAMVTYCYTHEASGNTIEVQHASIPAVVPQHVMRDGFLFARDYRAEQAGGRSGDPWTEHWSLAMACAVPSERREVAQRCREAGVYCHFDERGRAEIKSKSHQRAFAKQRFPGEKVSNRDDYY